MDRKVAKETRDAPIRQVDVIRNQIRTEPLYVTVQSKPGSTLTGREGYGLDMRLEMVWVEFRP